MGTRGLIGTPHDNGFSGRYVHMDSYPTGLGRELLETYQELGDWQKVVEHAVRPERNGYWSSYLLPSQEQDGVGGWNDVDEGLIAHTEDAGAEWAYVLDERGIHVIAAMRADGSKAVGMFGSIGDIVWESTGKVAWTDTDVDWERIECGEHFERCRHYAGAHFPEAEDTRIGIRTWLGLEPPSHDDLIALVIPHNHGQRLTLTGSGTRGTAHESDWRALQYASRRAHQYWWVSVEGQSRDVRAFRCLKAGFKLDGWDGIALTQDGEVVIPEGTVLR